MLGTFAIHHGDSRELVKQIGLVHCVVTSPPYFRKREYGDSATEIGKEKEVGQYIAALVQLFNDVNLHPRGNVWVNIGDKRNTRGGLSLIPERFAIAMADAGWLLMDNVVWAKVTAQADGQTEGGCMIEPVQNRLNGNGFEPFYRFARRKDAFFDPCSVALHRHNVESVRHLPADLMATDTSVEGRFLPNVWRVPMGQTKYLHYAVYPEALVERPVVSSCPQRVSADGQGLAERIIEMREYDEGRGKARIFGKYTSLTDEYDPEASKKVTGRVDSGRSYVPRKPVTVGWTPVENPVPGVVLDPFCGTATTGVVALKTGRSFVGIDLYSEFVDVGRDRLAKTLQTLTDPWAVTR